MKYFVLSKSESDDESDELFVATRAVGSEQRAIEIASKFTFSFNDIKIVKIVKEFKNAAAAKAELSQTSNNKAKPKSAGSTGGKRKRTSAVA